MKLVGAGGQLVAHYLFDASGKTDATSNTPTLVLPVAASRSHLLLQNLGTAAIAFEIGCARATAALTNGAVSSITVTNAGFNFTRPPIIRFLGGGNALGGGNVLSGGSAANSSYLGLNQPGGSSPSHPARAHAVLTSGAVTSIVIDDPGAGYAIAPFVQLINSDLAPYGAALPSVATPSGFMLQAAGTWGDRQEWNGTVCPTEAVSVISATASMPFLAKWME